MKRLFFLIVGLAWLTVSPSQAQTPVLANPLAPRIVLIDSVHDMGDIEQGEVLERIYRIKNAGMQPLILHNVHVTCGCTVPSWPRKPIAPGQVAEIKAQYNSSGKMGTQNRVITVESNASNNPVRLRLLVNVLPRRAKSVR